MKRDPEHDPEVMRRVGVAWRELRRGAASQALRQRIYGQGPEALQPGCCLIDHGYSSSNGVPAHLLPDGSGQWMTCSWLKQAQESH